jgi:hypothetical protein
MPLPAKAVNTRDILTNIDSLSDEDIDQLLKQFSK